MIKFRLSFRKGSFSLLGFLFLGAMGAVTSLSAATPTDSLQQVYRHQLLFGNTYTQERVYVHMDKPYYQLGDMLFYKIYATMGQGLFPDTLSKTLYVELLDASGMVLQSQKKYLGRGLSYGNMELPAQYAPGVYRLRAFTSWMRNFRSEPLFEQVISVYGSLRKDYNWHLSSTVSEGSAFDTLHLTLHLTDSLYRAVSSPYGFSFNGKGIQRVEGTLSTAKDGGNRMSLLLPKTRKEGLGSLTLTIGENSQQKDVMLSTKEVRAQFFPEGGQWVAGVRSRVAFKVTDEQGAGLDFSGVVRNTQGIVVASFKAQHLGMGAFGMTPQRGEKYTAEVTVNSTAGSGSAHTLQVSLPEVQPSGYVMEVDGASADSIRIRVRRAGIAQEQLLGLMIQNGGQVLWGGNLRMRTDSAKVILPRGALPTGVSQVTLYLPDGRPVSERLVFVNLEDALKVQITSPKQTFKPRERVSLNLMVSNPEGKPVQGSFSISVTDASQVTDTARYEENILTQLLLSSEVKGKIENPGYYFASQTPQQRQALEYLLLTQGWRRYRWDMALSDSLPKLEYSVDRGVPISGTIRNITNKKGMENHEVTLLLQNKEGLQLATYTTNVTGHFKFVPDFFGEAKVNLQTKYKGKNIERAIDLDKNEFSFDEVAQEASSALGGSSSQDALTQTLTQTQAAVEKYQKAQESAREYQAKTDSLMRTIDLKEVEVTARWNEKTEITKNADTTLLIREGMEAVRNNLNFNITDLEDFLVYTYPTRFRRVGEEDSVRYMGAGSAGGSLLGRPFGVLDNGWLSGLDKILGINCYSKVEIIDKWGAGFRYGLDAEYVVVALTRNPDAMCFTQNLGVRNYKMQGYALAKEFFSPDYGQENASVAPDVRSTLFWAPHVQTDATGKATVTFFNSDNAKGMQVNVQGMSTAGTTGAGVGTVSIGGK